MAELTTITAEEWSRADPITKMRVNEITSAIERGEYTPGKLAAELRALVVAAVEHEREACAKIAIEQGECGCGEIIADMIRARAA